MFDHVRTGIPYMFIAVLFSLHRWEADFCEFVQLAFLKEVFHVV